MAKNRLITKEARERIIEQLHDRGETEKSELIEMIRPYCSFDEEALKEQALNRLAGSIVRSIRDSSGVRSVFIIRNADTVVDVDTCKSLDKVAAVEEQLARQMDGIQASHRKAERRKQELSGQVDLFAAEQ